MPQIAVSGRLCDLKADLFGTGIPVSPACVAPADVARVEP